MGAQPPRTDYSQWLPDPVDQGSGGRNQSECGGTPAVFRLEPGLSDGPRRPGSLEAHQNAERHAQCADCAGRACQGRGCHSRQEQNQGHHFVRVDLAIAVLLGKGRLLCEMHPNQLPLWIRILGQHNAIGDNSPH